MDTALLSYRHAHLVGIKGVAMTSLALCLQDAGLSVVGSDVPESFVTEDILKSRKFHVFHNFSPENIQPPIDVVVYTGAHQGKNNPEVKEAVRLGIPVMSHAEALGSIMTGKRVISVCGTGGKSTTTAMIAWTLECAGLHPSFAVGVGNVPNLGTPGRYIAESQWFIAEADEYAVDPTSDHRPRFIYQHPEVIVCTNLKYDHPDIYPSFEKMKDTFLAFFDSLPSGGLLVINGDDEELVALCKLVREGIEIVGVVESDLLEGNYSTSLSVPGDHNKRNAAAAYAVAQKIGIKSDIAKEALSSFSGTMRRFEYKGIVHGAKWYDDYAHTPDEIKSTLTTMAELFPDKHIIAIFQPHTFSRTKSLFNGFSQAFDAAHDVILLDIFASAREEKDSKVSSDLLKEAIASTSLNIHVKNMKTIERSAEYVLNILHDDCVVITLGAGDVYKIFDVIQHKNL